MAACISSSFSLPRADRRPGAARRQSRGAVVWHPSRARQGRRQGRARRPRGVAAPRGESREWLGNGRGHQSVGDPWMVAFRCRCRARVASTRIHSVAPVGATPWGIFPPPGRKAMGNLPPGARLAGRARSRRRLSERFCSALESAALRPSAPGRRPRGAIAVISTIMAGEAGSAARSNSIGAAPASTHSARAAPGADDACFGRSRKRMYVCAYPPSVVRAACATDADCPRDVFDEPRCSIKPRAALASARVDRPSLVQEVAWRCARPRRGAGSGS